MEPVEKMGGGGRKLYKCYELTYLGGIQTIISYNIDHLFNTIKGRFITYNISPYGENHTQKKLNLHK
jgi:hypothetical protein